MADQWYYVDGSNRVGPIKLKDIRELLKVKKLRSESYVWTPGYEDWKQVKDVSELAQTPAVSPSVNVPPPLEEKKNIINWQTIDTEKQIFTVKIGYDRKGEQAEYGPFSITMLKKLFKESRINSKTFIFTPGMENWSFLGDIPIYEKISGSIPPVISDADKRNYPRKPFVARMFFHDNKQLFEGICRDISIGGMQVLVSNFNCVLGEKISLNVHPENSDYSFVASGEVVRVLPGNQGFSFRFAELSPEARTSIEKYIHAD